MKISKPKRRRKREENVASRPNKITVKYFIRTNKENVPVCCKFFKSVFSVTTRRLNTIAKYVQEGSCIKEKRGGNRKELLFKGKRDKVIDFISKLRGRLMRFFFF